MNRHVVLLLLSLILFKTAPTQAGLWEASTGFNFNRSEYSGGSYTWTRRWGASLGYNFSDSSQIEVAYQNNFDRNHYQGYEDSFYDDEVYSVNWVQNLLSKEHIIQPYFKLGAGQLFRRATVSNSLGQTQISEQNSVTGVIGVGSRLMVTRGLGFRVEATSYLTGGKLGSWKDNIGFSFGGSVYF